MTSAETNNILGSPRTLGPFLVRTPGNDQPLPAEQWARSVSKSAGGNPALKRVSIVSAEHTVGA